MFTFAQKSHPPAGRSTASSPTHAAKASLGPSLVARPAAASNAREALSAEMTEERRRYFEPAFPAHGSASWSRIEHTKKDSPPAPRAIVGDVLQKKCKPCEEEEQKQLLQKTPAGSSTVGAQASVHETARRGISGAGERLPYLDTIQRSFGRHDVSGVVAHTDQGAAMASRDLGAKAFTRGSHVAFDGTPDLHTAAHEAAHAVQQRSGVHLAGGMGEVGDPYERHADAVADRVVAGQPSEDLLDQHAKDAESGRAPGIQRALGCAVAVSSGAAVGLADGRRHHDDGEPAGRRARGGGGGCSEGFGGCCSVSPPASCDGCGARNA